MPGKRTVNRAIRTLMKAHSPLLPLLLLAILLSATGSIPASQPVESDGRQLFTEVGAGTCQVVDCLFQQHYSGSETPCCNYPCDSTSTAQICIDSNLLPGIPATPIYAQGIASALPESHPDLRFRPPLASA